MLYRGYLKGMYTKFGSHATWLPGQKLALGDVGVVDGGVFKRLTSLGQLGIPFSSLPAGQMAEMDHRDERSVTVSANAGAGTAPNPVADARGKAEVVFSSEGAFLFRALKCKAEIIADHVELERRLLEALEDGTWKPEWRVIDRLWHAASTTVMVASSAGARVGVSAEGKLAQGFDLADVSAGLSYTREAGEVTLFVAERGLTPLYEMSRVKVPWFGKPRLESTTFAGAEEKAGLEKVGFDDQDAEAS